MQNPSGPPPYEDAGGFLVIPKGQTGALRLNLSAGSYAAICFVTDPASGKTHAELGMINQFTAQ